MTPVQAEELSALLDGELPAERARWVERQIAADPQLRSEFQRLCEQDERWRLAAATAAFQPTIRLPREGNRTREFAAAAALVVTLIAVRMAAKLTESFALSFGVHGVALLCLIAGVVWLTRDEGDRPLVSGRLR